MQLVAPPTSGSAVRAHLLRCCLISLHIYRLSSTTGLIETPSLSGLEGVASTPETPLNQPISQMENRGWGRTEHTLGLSPTASSASWWGPIWEVVGLASSPPVSFVPAPATQEALPSIISVFIRLHPGI